MSFDLFLLLFLLFVEFVNESEKFTILNELSSLILFDNAICHKAKSIIKLYIQQKLKILTNIPYKSEYNGIEYCFCFFKNLYYKFILKNKAEQKQKIEEILYSNELKKNSKSFYLQALVQYKKFFEDEGNKNEMEDIFGKIMQKKRNKLLVLMN